MSSLNRSEYYTLADIQTTYKISRKKLQKILDEHQPPVILVDIQTTYLITANYYKKVDIDSLMSNHNSP